jgi:hypothetical protein
MATKMKLPVKVIVVKSTRFKDAGPVNIKEKVMPTLPRTKAIGNPVNISKIIVPNSRKVVNSMLITFSFYQDFNIMN